MPDHDPLIDFLLEAIPHIRLYEALLSLTATEEDVIVLRYWGGLSQAEAGRRLGLSRERVRQIISGHTTTHISEKGKRYVYYRPGAVERLRKRYRGRRQKNSPTC